MHQTLRVAATALAMLIASPAVGRPYTIDDMLHQEALGAEAIDPSGRWLVFERSDPYDTATRFDNDAYNTAAISRLMLVDLTKPGPAHPLLSGRARRGQMLNAFSPSGARVAICHYDGRRYTLGVVELATGKVRWFDDITPEKSFYGRELQWLSDEELVVIARPKDDLTWPLRIGHVSSQRVPVKWEATAVGTGAHTVFGSGRYASLREKPAPRLLLRLNVVTGARRPLATGLFLDLEVSPDHAKAALLEAGDSVQSRAGETVQGDRGIETETTWLSILDLQTGGRAELARRLDTLPHLLDWSPSGRELLVYQREIGATWTSGGLFTIDAASGRSRRLDDGLVPKVFLRPTMVYAGWMGEDPILLARPAAEPNARFDWFRLAATGPVNLSRRLPSTPWSIAAISAARLAIIAGGSLWRVDVTGRAERQDLENAHIFLDPRLKSAKRLFNAPPSGSWLISGAGADRRVQWVDAQRASDPIRLPSEAEPLVAISQKTGSVVVSARDPHGVESLNLLRPGAGPMSLAVINQRLAMVDATRILRIAHTGPDGQALSSWLLLPPRRPGARPPPLVIRPYSGQSFAEPPVDLPNERGFVGNYRALVGHGYAVLAPSLPLPRDRLDPMPGLADRILAIVDTAAHDPTAKDAFDPTRLALLGHSYGGYTVQAAIGQSDRFRAAVSIAGLSDVFSQWETLAAPYRAMPEDGAMFNWSMGSVEAGQDEMLRPPWEDPARYVRNSPLFAVNSIRTPLLLFHGEQDLIQVEQSDAMFAALYRQAKDAILVTYWGEGHAINSPGNVRDLFERTFRFLDEHLGLTSARGDAAPRPVSEPASGAPTLPPPRSSGARLRARSR